MFDDLFSKVVVGFIAGVALLLVVTLAGSIFFPPDHSRQHPCGTNTYYVQIGKMLYPETETVWCAGTPTPDYRGQR